MKYKQTLVNQINKANASKEAKEYLIKQVNQKNSITDIEVKKAIERLPNVINSVEKYLIKYKNILKGVHGLETHQYAPELNTIVFKNGTEKRVPGVTTIEKAIDYLIYNN